MTDDTERSAPSTKSAPFDFNAGQKAHDIIKSALDEIDAPVISSEKKQEMMRIFNDKDYSPSQDHVAKLNDSKTKDDFDTVQSEPRLESSSKGFGPLYDSNLQFQAKERRASSAPSVSDTTAQRVPKSDSSRTRDNKYKELCRKPSMSKMDSADLEVMEELSDVVAPVNKAVTLLEDFNRRYADWINEEKFISYRNALRETATIMLSEFYSLRNGQKEKTYSQDKVCQDCHAVFMFALPDGLCDECRGRKTRRNAYDSLET